MKNNKTKLFSLTSKDFIVESFSGSGAGGQHRNRHPNCIRIKHKESGTSAQCTKHRSLHQNKQEAFINLTKDTKFKLWLNQKIGEVIHGQESIEEKVKDSMRLCNLKIEGFSVVKDKWEKIK